MTEFLVITAISLVLGSIVSEFVCGRSGNDARPPRESRAVTASRRRMEKWYERNS